MASPALITDLVRMRTRVVAGKRVTVLPFWAVERYKPSRDSLLISILDTDGDIPTIIFSRNYSNIVQLRFDDIEQPYPCERVTLLHVEQAKVIVSILRAFAVKSGGDLVVHCTAGISRSAAVAAAYCQMVHDAVSRDFFLGSLDFRATDVWSGIADLESPFFANRYVYNTLTEVMEGG